jgi:hypothetical protein
MSKLLYEDLSYKTIDVAREVYKELGPGYLESVCEDVLCYDLDLLTLGYQRNVEKIILIIQCNSVKIRGKLLPIGEFLRRKYKYGRYQI